jgi:hypothetical protein
MVIPSIDDDIALEIPDDATRTDPHTWVRPEFTVEISSQQPTDPQTRPFDIDAWCDAFAHESGNAPNTVRVVEPAAPDDIGGIALDAAGKEVRLILFSSDNGDYRTVRVRLAGTASMSAASKIRVRSRSRRYDKALGDILPP